MGWKYLPYSVNQRWHRLITTPSQPHGVHSEIHASVMTIQPENIIMAEQETQLISKIVTDNTRTPVGERGVQMGRRHATGWEMLIKICSF